MKITFGIYQKYIFLPLFISINHKSLTYSINHLKLVRIKNFFNNSYTLNKPYRGPLFQKRINHTHLIRKKQRTFFPKKISHTYGLFGTEVDIFASVILNLVNLLGLVDFLAYDVLSCQKKEIKRRTFLVHFVHKLKLLQVYPQKMIFVSLCTSSVTQNLSALISSCPCHITNALDSTQHAVCFF